MQSRPDNPSTEAVDESEGEQNGTWRNGFD
jgi:hypothetical protein